MTSDDPHAVDAPKRPWWKNEWLAMLLVIGILHATGMLVHVQATLQRGLLLTGLFRADILPPGERTALPDGIVLTDASGEVIALDSLRGDVLFLNLWASWCAPCLAEMPAIDRLYASHGDRVRFFMVSLDDDPALGIAHVQRKGFRFAVHRPAGRLPATVFSGVLPTTLVIDQAGRIAVRHEGMAGYDSARFRAGLDQLLSDTR